MGQKALIRLIIIFAVVGVIALIFKLAGPGKVETVASSTDREKVFADFPVNDVSKIRIKSSDGEVNLAKGDSGWVVAERGDYPADAGDAIEFLRSVWDLKVVQSPEIGESQYSRLSLLDPDKGGEGNAATVVSFLNAEGKELDSLWLGKVVERSSGQPSPLGGMSTTEAGRYVKTGNEPSVFLVKETFSDIETDPAEWLDDEFFKIEKVKTIEIKTDTPEEDWKLTREEESGDFTLVGAKEGEELDPVKVGSMKNAFSSPRFEDVLMDEEAPGKTTFVITTFGNFTYTVKLGEKNDINEYPLTFEVSADIPQKRKPAEEESDEEAIERDEAFAETKKAVEEKLAKEKAMAGKVYKVRSYVADSLVKKRSELLKAEDGDDQAGSPQFTPGSAPPAGTPDSIPGMPKGIIPEIPQIPKGAAPGAEPAKEKQLPDPGKEMPAAGKEKAAPKGKAKPADKEKAKPAAKEKAKEKAAPPAPAPDSPKAPKESAKAEDTPPAAEKESAPKSE